MSTELFDCAIIGAGIAGVSLGYELSADSSVVILEAEEQPAYHATGRSAAFFTELFGNETVRSLTSASREFFETPPHGFADRALLTPRGALYLGRADQQQAVRDFYQDAVSRVPDLKHESADFARARVPILRDGVFSECVYEPGARQIDVDGLLQGYLRGFRANGGRLLTNAALRTARRERGAWKLETAAGECRARLLVNAAGAWADQVAAIAGARPARLQPMRRTVCVVDSPKDCDCSGWPAVTDIAHSFYFVPDVGRLLLSPADETPVPPVDAYPEDIDVAAAVDRFEKVATMTVQRVLQQWAGLRTFAPDRSPVVGPDPDIDGFYWFAGQGGYGIQMAPALARCGAALIDEVEVRRDFFFDGLRVAKILPGRV